MRKIDSVNKDDREMLNKFYLNMKKYSHCTQTPLMELSKNIGRSASYISQIKGRDQSITLVTAYRISEALGLKLSDLIERDPKDYGALEEDLMVKAARKRIEKEILKK